ncbi:uncharacterized protein OCT59_027951 [Rhizophagus irregularis]|uniref:uncharacterized protein n=1 Tax=Rhizophagus irregularis TaxID=588596 RepID=UPI00331E1540|nr:hypothetical protein OCT59_027951 [Rhizophagus irregularis]
MVQHEIKATFSHRFGSVKLYYGPFTLNIELKSSLPQPQLLKILKELYLSSRDLLNETRLHSNLALNDVIDVYSVLFFYNLRYKIEWVKCV